jgi:2,5-diamino-6-(ribosylamino)-4(3H)-pyrimidinone 5'-phosphate reductase
VSASAGAAARGAPLERPRVWVNCASSLDGRIAYAGGERARLSSPEDLVRVHRLRAASDGILVGVGTVVHDDPSLTVRAELLDGPLSRPPTRIVVDGSGRLPEGARILDSSAPTIVATTEANPRVYPTSVRVVRSGRTTVDLGNLLTQLRAWGVEKLMVEGGAQILASVARGGWWDRWTIYYAPVLIGGTTAPPMLAGPESTGPGDLVRGRVVDMSRLGEGFLVSLERGSGSSAASPGLYESRPG